MFQSSVKDVSRFPFIHKLCTAFNCDGPCDSLEPFVLQTKDNSHSNSSVPNNNVSLPDPLSISNDQVDIKSDEPSENTNLDLTATLKHAISSGPSRSFSRTRKRNSEPSSSNFSNDFFALPAKRVKRSSSCIESSFVLSAKADPLRLSNGLIQTSETNTSFDIGTADSDNYYEYSFWPDDSYENVANQRFEHNGSKQFFNEGD